jgi:hypothetical protein
MTAQTAIGTHSINVAALAETVVSFNSVRSFQDGSFRAAA